MWVGGNGGVTDRWESKWSAVGLQLSWPPLPKTLFNTPTSNTPPSLSCLNHPLSSNHCCVQLEALNQSKSTYTHKSLRFVLMGKMSKRTFVYFQLRNLSQPIVTSSYKLTALEMAALMTKKKTGGICGQIYCFCVKKGADQSERVFFLIGNSR